MSNYPPGVTDDDPYFTDESEPEGEEEPDAPPTSEPRTSNRTGSVSTESNPRTS